MAFWHDTITQKSFQLLLDLKKKYAFILIGGWSVWLYTKALKSKDIDIIVDYEELIKLKNDYDLVKNSRLKKYEIKTEAVEVDVYLPHFSELGLKVETVMQYVQRYEGFSVPWPEVLLILKQAARKDRLGTTKGRKDELDIISLLLSKKIHFTRYGALLREHHQQQYAGELRELLRDMSEVKALKLNRHQYRRFKDEVLKSMNEAQRD